MGFDAIWISPIVKLSFLVVLAWYSCGGLGLPNEVLYDFIPEVVLES